MPTESCSLKVLSPEFAVAGIKFKIKNCIEIADRGQVLGWRRVYTNYKVQTTADEAFTFFKIFILDFYDKNSVTCTSEYKDPSRESDFLGKLYYRDSATRFKKNHIWGF